MITQFALTLKEIISALQKEAAIILAILTELGVAPAAGHNVNAQSIILASYAAIVHALDSVAIVKATPPAAVKVSQPLDPLTPVSK